MEEVSIATKLLDQYGPIGFGAICFAVILVLFIYFWKSVIVPFITIKKDSDISLLAVSENIKETASTQERTALVNKEIAVIHKELSVVNSKCMDKAQKIMGVSA